MLLADNINSVTSTLNTFYELSRQVVSLEKTYFYFSKNVSQASKRLLADKSGFKVCRNMGKYLGVPILGRAPKRNGFQYIIDKVNGELAGWKSNHLSFAGRVTLSKAVIHAISIYTMMTTPICQSVLEEIQQLQRGFIGR